MSHTHRIAVIAGDGIGQEVMPEGMRVLQAAASRFDIALQFDTFDFSSCDYYARHGKMLPDAFGAGTVAERDAQLAHQNKQRIRHATLDYGARSAEAEAKSLSRSN